MPSANPQSSESLREEPGLVRRGRMADRLAPWLLAAAVCAAAALLVRHGGALYFGAANSDLASYFYPQRDFLHRWLDRGILPLWNPHFFGGYPVLEVQQHALLNPVSILTALWLGAREGLGVMMALHFALAAGLTFAGLRIFFRASPSGAALGAAAFAFGSATASRAAGGHFTVIGASAWMPLAALALFRAVECLPAAMRSAKSAYDLVQPASDSAKEKGPQGPAGLNKPKGRQGLRRRCAAMLQWLAPLLRRPVRPPLLMAGAANAMTLLAGAPQYAAMLFWMEAVLCLASSRRRTLARAAFLFAGAWGIAALLACPQWLPTLAYLPFTGRGGIEMNYSSTPLDHLVFVTELLLPFPLGDDVEMPHLNAKNIWETSAYMGVLPLLLGAAFVWRYASAWKRRSARSQAAFYLLALGILATWGLRLPGFASFREPLKMRTILALGIALAAVLEWDRLRIHVSQRPHLRPRRIRRPRPSTFAKIYILFCLLALATLVICPLMLASYFPGGSSPLDPSGVDLWYRMYRDPSAAAPGFARSILIAGGLAVVAGVLLSALRPGEHWIWQRGRPRSKVRNANTARAALLLLGIADPLCHSARFLTARHPFEAIEAPREWREFFEPRIAATRAAHEPPWRVTMPSEPPGRCLHIDGMWDTGGYDPLMPREANSRIVLAGLSSMDSSSTGALLRSSACGRRFLLNIPGYWGLKPATDFRAMQEFPGVGIASIERDVAAGKIPEEHYGPNVRGVTYVAPPSAARVAEGIRADALDAPFRSRIEQIARACSHSAGAPDRIGMGALARGESLRTVNPGASPNQYEFEARLAAPALLLFRMTWLPGWRVRVDKGIWETPLFANNWMQAATLPPGDHHITFSYCPARYGLSLGVSAVSGILIVLWIFAVEMLGKREKSQNRKI